MESQLPLFIVLDAGLRALLILFLLVYAIKFRSYLMIVLLSLSSITLYLVFFRNIDKDGLFLTLAGEVTAFMLVYILYEYMRLKYVLREAPTLRELREIRKHAMDIASDLPKNKPNTRNGK